MGSSVLRRTNHLANLMKSSVFRSSAASNPSGNSHSVDDVPNFLLSSPSPLHVPVATKYWKPARMWKWVPIRIGEDHVQPDVHARHSFEQRLRAIRSVDEDLHRVHDIGLPRVDARARRMERAKELREMRKRMKADLELERASRLRQLEVDAVECEREELSGGGGDGEDAAVARTCAHHYGVFRDLFGRHADFDNVVNASVEFAVETAENGEGVVAPVFYGNFIDAAHCAEVPSVEIIDRGENDDALWTLIMSSPDQNFIQSSGEFLHWMVGNINGSSITSGTTIVPYLPPFPMRGFGPLRYVLVLYKQAAPIDFSSLTDVGFDDPKTAFVRRGFSSHDFLRQHQDVLTPASQRFFQSTHDESVTQIFYDRLDMKEPTYAYDWPEPARDRQMKTPFVETSFNEYLDLYRDRKDINEQVLKERLSMMKSPFEGYPTPDVWPNAIWENPAETPTWLRDELSEKRLRRGKWRDLKIRD